MLSLHSIFAPTLEQLFSFFHIDGFESLSAELTSTLRISDVVLYATDLVPRLEGPPSSASIGLASSLIPPEIEHYEDYPYLFLDTRPLPSSLALERDKQVYYELVSFGGLKVSELGLSAFFLTYFSWPSNGLTFWA